MNPPVLGEQDRGRAGDVETLESPRAGDLHHDVSVLLAHQPASAYEASEAGFDFQISGHTHGGQFFPGTALIHLAHPVARGLGKVGRSLVYVSCGTGYWGPPFRLGAPAEITELTLVSEATS